MNRRRLSRAHLVALLTAFIIQGGAVAFESPTTGKSIPLFIPPFAGSPSLETWHLGQPYGNTVFAFRARKTTYIDGQGLHFGIDLNAQCGTPVLAIGAGIVYSIDGPWGSFPHNVVLRHNNGLFSLYGHLRVKTIHLSLGQSVKQGDILGVTGDWIDSIRCNSSPHLHLEIRTESMRAAINPIPLISADWQDASLGIGGANPTFQINMASPRRWQSLFDQPDIRFGGPLLNDYTEYWPHP